MAALLRPSWASETTTPGELAQELGPDRLGLRGADLHAQNLAPAVCVDADRDDASAAAHLEVGGVDPQIRPVAFDGAIEQGFHLAVDLLAQAADLALRDARHAHDLDEIVDRARRDALYIGLLNDGHPARVSQSRSR